MHRPEPTGGPTKPRKRRFCYRACARVQIPRVVATFPSRSIWGVKLPPPPASKSAEVNTKWAECRDLRMCPTCIFFWLINYGPSTHTAKRVSFAGRRAPWLTPLTPSPAGHTPKRRHLCVFLLPSPQGGGASCACTRDLLNTFQSTLLERVSGCNVIILP